MPMAPPSAHPSCSRPAPPTCSKATPAPDGSTASPPSTRCGTRSRFARCAVNVRRNVEARVLVSLAIVCLVGAPARAQKPDVTGLEKTVERIASHARGRVGVALIHLESGSVVLHRGDERFPMASVVKLPIAIEVLKQVSERRLTLDRPVWLGPSDIRPCCTIERHHPN